MEASRLGLTFVLARVCFLLSLFTSVAKAVSTVANADSTRIFNVVNYGAVGDGKTDNTKAFQNAWNEACASVGMAGVLIPEGKFLVGPLKFRGPCKNQMLFQLKGAMIASPDLSVYDTTEWIAFHYIDGLTITGGGKFDGQGALAWPHNNCDTNPNCKKLPQSINFSFVNNAVVRDVTSVDSKNFHINIFASKNMKLQSLKISAPRDSPNTDGIHLGGSSNIEISNSVIGTGDDCISIGPGVANMTISDVFCGPGHGISVGSLGGDKNEKDVIGLKVTNCTLTGTENGLRIKTWQDSPTVSAASDFVFDGIVMNDVENPIVVDQKYCPHNQCRTKMKPSKVKISNIKFKNIRGDSKTKVAISLLCSDEFPCEDVELDNINLKYIGGEGEATSSCTNVKGKSIGVVIPKSCI